MSHFSLSFPSVGKVFADLYSSAKEVASSVIANAPSYREFISDKILRVAPSMYTNWFRTDSRAAPYTIGILFAAGSTATMLYCTLETKRTIRRLEIKQKQDESKKQNPKNEEESPLLEQADSKIKCSSGSIEENKRQFTKEVIYTSISVAATVVQAWLIADAITS